MVAQLVPRLRAGGGAECVFISLKSKENLIYEEVLGYTFMSIHLLESNNFTGIKTSVYR